MKEETSRYATANSGLGDPTGMISRSPIHHEAQTRSRRIPSEQVRLLRTALVCGALCIAWGTAHAETEPAIPAAPRETTGQSAVTVRALRPLSWKKTPGQGLSFGYEGGLWGNSMSQGLRVTVPFNAHFGLNLRGLYLIAMTDDGPFTADAGGRFEFFGRSEVMFNVLRLYGGGGVQVLAPAANTAGREVLVGGGGQFGFEFFHNPHCSFFLEVGGQGGLPSPGATVLAGMNFYPWTR